MLVDDAKTAQKPHKNRTKTVLRLLNSELIE